MKPLVILRPEPGASRTVARAQALGLQVVRIPLFAVVPIEWRVPDPKGFDGLVLTSANAVRHAGEDLQKLKSLPVHAVGDATARLAHSAGFTVASVGQGGSGAMDLPAGQRLLHLTGRDHRAVPGTTAVAVYEARALDAPPGLDQLGHCVVAAHSPRAGARFADLVRDRGDIAIVAISTAAAQAVGTGWQTISAATEPNDEALLALAVRLCEGRDA